MRFFSKLVFVCNLCFIASVILRYIEFSGQRNGSRNSAIPLPWLENTLVTLGYGAIILNIAFFLSYIILILAGKHKLLPQWLIIFNIALLVVQCIYFFTNLIK